MSLPNNNIPALISVIIPVYNQERHIGECLRSILKQSYKDLEVIAVNDGSTDHSLQIIRKMASKDQRIIIIDQQNQGEALARKNGYKKAHGEYLMFVDHDDMLLPDAVATLYQTITQTKVDVVCGHALRKWGWKTRTLRCYPASMSKRVLTQEDLFDNYYVSFFGINLFPVTLWGKLYRKVVIDNAMATVDLFTTPHLHFGGDEAFNLLLFPHLKSAYLTEYTVYLYRWGGLTSGFNHRLPELLDFSDFRIGLLDKYHYQKGYVPLFIEYANILISHVLQGLEYRAWSSGEAKEWLQKELDTRYLVQRMQKYYLHEVDVPEKCRLVLSRDLDGILNLAETKRKQQRLRSIIKRMRWIISKH